MNHSAITIHHLSKSFGNKQVLNDLNLTIPYGETTAIMASSGAGKTTLIRILMGLESADSGEILGMEGLTLSAVFQEDRLCKNLTALANIRLVSPQCSKDEIATAMEHFGLAAIDHQPVKELSGGMQRRVAILRALLADYDILFLDEPFTGLDLATKEIVIADTRKRCQGKTVLFITHIEEEVELIGASKIIHL